MRVARASRLTWLSWPMIEIDGMKLYDVEDLTKLLGLQERTVRKLIKIGQLKGRKLAKKWYVIGESMKEYFNQPASEQEQQTISQK